MTTHVLKELLLWRQDHNLMEQPQRHIVLELPSILDEPPKDIQMRLVLLAPALQRGQVVEVCQPKCLVRLGERLGPLIVLWDHVHEATGDAADFFALIT